MNSRLLFNQALAFWYRISGGRIAGSFRGAPVLLLTTTGRKSGKQRTTPLLYVRDENRLAIVASNGGRDNDPSWWMNLQYNSRAKVQIKGESTFVVARKATQEEKERLWPILTRMYPQYDAYQANTKRDIPVVILALAAESF